MSIKHLQTYSHQKNVYDIDENLKIDISIVSNPYNIPLDTMFAMALRENKKRRFLFVSKILGKHIPVNPYVPLLGGATLALQYLNVVYNINNEDMSGIIETLINKNGYKEVYQRIKSSPLELPERTIFIGFAETATALGHAMFDYFPDNGFYIHTTREFINELQVIVKFEEEHSHATSHRLYSTEHDFLNSEDTVVLIDDEITTGKTALNIIEAIQKVYPRKRYVIVSLLDWRSKEDMEAYKNTKERLGIEIIPVSLISGTININERPSGEYTRPAASENENNNPDIRFINVGNLLEDKTNLSSVDSFGEINRCPYISATGRFGISSAQNKEFCRQIEDIGEFLKSTMTGGRTLCLGTGEFMFIPALISSYMGNQVSYHSTTRSPVYAIDKDGYGVSNAFSFESLDDPAVINYLYNIPYGYYDNIYVFFERTVREERLHPLIDVLKRMGIPKVFIVKLA